MLPSSCGCCLRSVSLGAGGTQCWGWDAVPDGAGLVGFGLALHCCGSTSCSAVFRDLIAFFHGRCLFLQGVGAGCFW